MRGGCRRAPLEALLDVWFLTGGDLILGSASLCLESGWEGVRRDRGLFFSLAAQHILMSPSNSIKHISKVGFRVLPILSVGLQ